MLEGPRPSDTSVNAPACYKYMKFEIHGLWIIVECQNHISALKRITQDSDWSWQWKQVFFRIMNIVSARGCLLSETFCSLRWKLRLLARGMPEGRATLQIRYPVRMTTPGARTTSLSGSEHFTDWQCPSSAQVTTLARLLWSNFQAGVNGFAGAIQNSTAGAHVSPVSTDCNPIWSHVTNCYWRQNNNHNGTWRRWQIMEGIKISISSVERSGASTDRGWWAQEVEGSDSRLIPMRKSWETPTLSWQHQTTSLPILHNTFVSHHPLQMALWHALFARG